MGNEPPRIVMASVLTTIGNDDTPLVVLPHERSAKQEIVANMPRRG